MGITSRTLSLIDRYQDAVVVEIGVAQGESAEKILSIENVKRYIGVDPWLRYSSRPSDSYQEGYLDRKMGLWSTQEDWENAYHRTIKRLERFGKRAQILRLFSHEAAACFQDSIDVLHIDGNHQYSYVLADLKMWYPKLRQGGIIIADDFNFSGGDLVDGFSGQRSCQVKEAVLDFCNSRDLNYYIIDGSAIVHKPYDNLLRYRNLHSGKRVFLIGNGPSLRQTKLDLIKDEYSIAMNRISLIYANTFWRPSYYIYASDNVNNQNWGQEWRKSVRQAVLEPKTVSFIYELYGDCLPNNVEVEWLKSVTEFEIGTEGTFSTNASQWISKSGTSMNIALQLAYYMGFEQIFLLGCDLNWKTTRRNQKDPNHFDPNYSANIPDGERERLRMRKTHLYAYKYFIKANKEVYNLTQNTLLDVYPFASYEKIVQQPEWCGYGKDTNEIYIKLKRARVRYRWLVERHLENLPLLLIRMTKKFARKMLDIFLLIKNAP